MISFKYVNLQYISRALFVALVAVATIDVQTSEAKEVSGAWLSERRETTCISATTSKDLRTVYVVFTKEGFGELMRLHWLQGKNLHKLSGQAIFNFDNGSKHKLNIKPDNEKNELGFETAGGSIFPSLFYDLKKANSFTIDIGNSVIAGPFSLKGSTRALNKITEC